VCPKQFSEPMVRLAQIVQLHAPKLTLSPKVSSGVSKIVSEAIVRLVQTVDLSCTDSDTFSKRTKMRFYITHVTLQIHRVRPK
jgi:hypothetical protein